MPDFVTRDGGHGTGLLVPDLDDALVDTARELADLQAWADRNAHRNDAAYVEHQKPAVDRHIARHRQLLEEEA